MQINDDIFSKNKQRKDKMLYEYGLKNVGNEIISQTFG